MYFYRKIFLSQNYMEAQRVDRQELLEAVARAVARFQNATDLVDEAAAASMGVNRTDLRLVGLLWELGSLSAGRLAALASLSPGATTAALRRLERAGLARRLRDGADRRGVVVELTPTARDQLQAIYGPVGSQGMERLTRYSDDQLRLLRDFLVDGYQLQVAQAARIRRATRSDEGDD
jgi:DNA-binding MarR family transcriptional regulator